MKMARILAASSLIAALASCQSTNASKLGAPADVATKMIVVEPIVTHGGEISGTSQQSVLFGIFKWGGSGKIADNAQLPGSEDSLKREAIYSACETGSADIVLLPQYIVKEDNYFIFKKRTCTVTGYKGNITGVKSISTETKADVIIHQDKASGLGSFLP